MSDDELRGNHLHFDCRSGAAGDMTLGALLDAGVPVGVVRDALDRVGVGGDRLIVERAVKHGISATDVKVRTRDGHVHRAYRDIEKQVRDAGLDEAVSVRALEMLDRVARAEAAIHGKSVGDVTLHEVGAIDSIVDFVGTAAALAWLAPASVSAGTVALGHGTVTCAHGVLPVPAPATLAIFREVGAVVEDGGVARELCTPSGAAILAASVTAWDGMPAMAPVAIGYGAGDDDLADRANVLRVTVGRLAEDRFPDSVYRVEANIDDMSPEMCEHVASLLFAAGAVDAWWVPVSMKKSRPALELVVLTPEVALDRVVRVMLRETTSIGVRYFRTARRVLDREQALVDTPFGRLPIKVARMDGEVVNAAPEYEPCRRAAVELGVPLKQVFAAVLAAYGATSG